MNEIGTYELIQAFGEKVKEVCVLKSFGATYDGIEVVIEVRDYSSHPAGRFLVSVRRADDGREARSTFGKTLREAASSIQWGEIA